MFICSREQNSINVAMMANNHLPHSTKRSGRLKPKDKAYKALEKVVNDPSVIKDVCQLSLFFHTDDIEVSHSMMLKYVPKRQRISVPSNGGQNTTCCS